MNLIPLVIFHVSSGLIAILAGFVAMFYRKGSRGHLLSGNVFVVSMLCMSGSATVMALYLHVFRSVGIQITNVFAGVFASYLVTTAWWAARRKENETNRFDQAALLVVAALEVCYLTFGVEAVLSPKGLKYGYPAALYFVFAFIALLCVSGDVRMLLHGGIAGKFRIARHLWRMSFALFFAAGSFFLGQQKVMPASWRGSPVLWVPPLASLLLLLYWLIRVRFTNAFKKIGLRHLAEKGRAALREQILPG